MNNQEAVTRASWEHAAAILEPDRAIFRIGGNDAVDFLHRLTTNDLLTGVGQRAVKTCFCDEKGRLVAVADIIFSLQHQFLICSRDGVADLLAWIEKFIISEDIQLSEVTSEMAGITLLGPQVSSAIESAGLLMAGADCHEARMVGDETTVVWRDQFGLQPCARVLVRRQAQARVWSMLERAGVLIDRVGDAYQLLRVLCCAPEHGHEITRFFTPYDVGLRRTISHTKGCYVGQEVIARIDTYRKVRRGLFLLWSDTAVLPALGSEVVVGGDTVGLVTSAIEAENRVFVLVVADSNALSDMKSFQISGFNYTSYGQELIPTSRIFPGGS
jgi:tRNA-modifying protein YgfZ